MKRDKTRVAIFMPPQLKEQLMEEAEKLGISLSSLVLIKLQKAG